MRRLTGIFFLLFILLASSQPGRAEPQPAGPANDHSPLTQDRLVVFEAFMRST